MAFNYQVPERSLMRPSMYRSMDRLLFELKSTDMEQSEGQEFSNLLDYVYNGPAVAWDTRAD